MDDIEAVRLYSHREKCKTCNKDYCIYLSTANNITSYCTRKCEKHQEVIIPKMKLTEQLESILPFEIDEGPVI